jgi:hypothetical protein
MAYHWEIAQLVQRVAVPLLPVGFSVCELGDQYVQRGAKRYLAEKFYRALGCRRYVSIDGNGRATVCADLNRPIADLGRFHLVTDIGTGEHIFDQAQVWRTVHDLCAPEGLIVCDRPEQGYPGHCYWRADRGLFEDLARANHYRTLYVDRRTTSRGVMLTGIFRRDTKDRPFTIPQQQRYLGALQI